LVAAVTVVLAGCGSFLGREAVQVGRRACRSATCKFPAPGARHAQELTPVAILALLRWLNAYAG